MTGKAVEKTANDMRLTLLAQVHELMDIAERYARRLHKQGDTEERDYVQGAINFARKKIGPYNYNGSKEPEGQPR